MAGRTGKKNTLRRPKQTPQSEKEPNRPSAGPAGLQDGSPAEKMPSGRRRRRTPEEARRAHGTRTHRRKQRHTRILGGVLILLSVAAAVLLIITMLFTIQTVTVTGESRYETDLILGASGLEMGQNILRFSDEEVEERIIRALPYIRSVEVVRHYPSRVELVVTEVTQMGVAVYGDFYVLLDTDGKVIEEGLERAPSNVPVLVGLTVTEAQLGYPAVFENTELFSIAQEIGETLEKYSVANITRIDLSDELNLKMNYRQDTYILLGTRSELDYKIKFIAELIHKDMVDPAKPVLDASVPGQISARSLRDSEYTSEVGAEGVFDYEAGFPGEGAWNRE